MAAKKPMARLSGVERAAVLLMCLGPEVTGAIFDELEDTEVRLISRAMLQLEHIPSDTANQVVSEFTKAHSDTGGYWVKGDSFVQKAMEYSTDEERKSMLNDQLKEGLGFRPLETIAMLEPRMVASIIENEHPQTVALVLSTQTPEHTAKIIEYLPEAIKADIVYRMAMIEKVSPDVIGKIEESLRREIGMVASRDQQQVGGVDKVVDILGRMKGKDQQILNTISNVDAETAEAIRKRMFTFEDLIYLDTKALQSVMRETDNDTLTLALKTCSDDLKTAIFDSISSRAVEYILDELEAMGPQRLSDVEEAQQKIVSDALRLEQEGTIIIPGRGTQDVLV